MQINDYFVPVIHTFEFIDSEEEARQGTKTVLGTITSSLSDDLARDFAAQLPDWLDYNTLRGGHQNQSSLTPDECIEQLKGSLNLDHNQADALMRKVVALTVQESPGDLSTLIAELPDDWENIFNQSPKQEHISDETTM
ncbi:MAG TPA: DUF2267 domain-containing protein [Balneolaceae bacterium]|nr:DUF2267 domain-containing protein [Balneolaceae bacterium]